ncbi:MAG TPA: AMIN domain-containing protein [Crenotrichaceae bacterium]|nr:AMIN domain-containing protein [Crenotrichaceae bacterium]
MVTMMIRFALLFIVLLSLVTQPAFSASTEVKTVRYFASPEYNRLVFDVTGKVSYKLFRLDNPPRLVVDILNASSVKTLRQPTKNNDLLVKRVRAGRGKQGGIRFVADLTRQATFKSFQLDPKQEYGHRLVVDIFAQHDKARHAAKTKTTNRKSTRVSFATRSTSVKSNKQYQQVNNHYPGSSAKIVIAIDAGHGGKDPGAIGHHKTREKDVVLAISRKLAAIIDASPGMKSYMVRDGDYYVPLRDRMKRARKAKADLFISIHADSLKNKKVKGATVYTLSAGGAMKEARVWAKRKNQTELVSGISLRDKDTVLASVLLDLSQTATLEASDTVASHIFTHLKKTGPVLREKVQKKPYMVLKSPDIPSVLVETAFISNPDEESKLRSAGFQRRIARSIYRGITDYFSSRQSKPIQMAARSHKISPGETLSGIAQQYGVSMQRIREVNHISGNNIQAGKILKIRPGA